MANVLEKREVAVLGEGDGEIAISGGDECSRITIGAQRGDRDGGVSGEEGPAASSVGPLPKRPVSGR
jgi:hypothetical protein